MKKWTIYVICGLWMLVLIQNLRAINRQNERDVVEVVAQIDQTSSRTLIELSGHYEEKLNMQEAQELLSAIGRRLGIYSGYEINQEKKENGVVITYHKKNEQGEVILKYIQVNQGLFPEYYVTFNLIIPDGFGYALTYKKLAEEIARDYEIDGMVWMQFTGDCGTALKTEQKEKMLDELLVQSAARLVSRTEEDNLFTVYGYTDAIENYVTVSGRKVNVNIAFATGENGNTIYYVGFPVIRTDY